MGRELSFFADYHQGENSLTNYCGLIMKLIYNESPKQFEELLSILIKGKTDLIVGPIFEQQMKERKSIPDLTIIQKSFAIFFETKLTNWFYDDQINRHIEGLNKNADIKILFLLSNFEHNDLEDYFSKQIDNAKLKGVILQPLQIQDFLEALEEVCKNQSKHLQTFLEEFRNYLDRNELLLKWKTLLDVVNCGGTLHEIADGAYMCPDAGGAYNHRRAQYFGAYKNKTVAEIFEINAIVVIDKNFSNGQIKWNNSNIPNNVLIADAEAQIRKYPSRIHENTNVALQVFLLSKPAKTNFIKETSGGMFQSKKYFYNIADNCKTLQELAAKLENKKWGEFL
jgi:hypothetical protein